MLDEHVVPIGASKNINRCSVGVGVNCFAFGIGVRNGMWKKERRYVVKQGIFCTYVLITRLNSFMIKKISVPHTSNVTKSANMDTKWVLENCLYMIFYIIRLLHTVSTTLEKNYKKWVWGYFFIQVSFLHTIWKLQYMYYIFNIAFSGSILCKEYEIWRIYKNLEIDWIEKWYSPLLVVQMRYSRYYV